MGLRAWNFSKRGLVGHLRDVRGRCAGPAGLCSGLSIGIV